MTRPSLTVWTPNYNHGDYIGRAIEAVVSQSRPPDEYIILDDASTDGSAQIIASYARRYPYIRFIRSEVNMGTVAAMQRLLSTATGDYVYGAAADDYILPEFFEKAMQMAGTYPDAGIVFGQSRMEDHTGRDLGVVDVPSWRQPMFVSPDQFFREYLERCEPMHSLCGATVYKRTYFLEVGGPLRELGPWCDTFAAWAIALKYGACYIPEPFMVWRILPDSFSNATARDPRKTLDWLARGVYLMRSPVFRDRFPDAYVRRWERESRAAVIKSAVWRRRAGRIQHGLPLVDRFLDWWVAMRLNLYRGDLSCYTRATSPS